MKQLVIVLAALGLFGAAMPTRAAAQNYFMRGYIINYAQPFTIDSLEILHPAPPRERFTTFGFGGEANAMDSFDLRVNSYPILVNLFCTQHDSMIYTSVTGARHVWYAVYNPYDGDSCLVMFDSCPLPGVQESNPVSPLRLALSGATPNPFTDYTTIGFAAPEARPVELTIYNLVGQPVKTLVAGFEPAGSSSAVWNGTDDAGHALAGGIYFCQLSAGGTTQTRKLILDR